MILPRRPLHPAVFGIGMQALALSALIGVSGRPFSDYILLAATAVVFAVLLIGYRTLLAETALAGLPLGALAVSAFTGFVLFRDPGGTTDAALGFRIAALGIAALGVGLSFAPGATTKKAYALIAGWVGVSLLSVYALDLNTELRSWMRWSSGLFWALSIASCGIAAKALASPCLRPWVWAFFGSAAAVSALIAGFGLMAGSRVLYHCDKALAALATGRHETFATHADAMVQEGKQIGVDVFAMERMLAGATTGAIVDRDGHALTVLGNAAVKSGLWDEAVHIFETATVLAPGAADVQAGYSLALSETGKNLPAIKYLSRIRDEGLLSGVGVFALVLLQAEVRDAGMLASGRQLYRGWLDPLLFASHPVRIYAQRADIFPDSLVGAFGSRISLYEIVRVLEAAGGRVFHPGMSIGSTWVSVPVDIEAHSGGGNTWPREGVWVEGANHSQGKRGYNIVVIDAASGEVVDSAVFDTWENWVEGERMADYLAGIDYGRIVVGAIRDEGASGLVSKTRDELRKLGVKHFPPYWGCHSFIGVKGAVDLEIIEAFGLQDNPVTVGVLGADDDLPVEDREALLQALAREAEAARGGFAVYIAGLGSEDAIAIVRD